MASKPFYTVADRILGSKFLQDIAEFFLLFQTMYRGFVERAAAVTKTLADKRTTFVVVSTLESAPLREAEFFIDALDERGLHLGAVVLNKVLPEWFLDHGATGAAKALCTDAAEIAKQLDGELGESEQVARVLREIGESFLNFQVVAKREAETRAELGRARGDRLDPLLRSRHLRPRGPPPPRRPDLAMTERGALVAAGHEETTRAAVGMLAAGGNAYDAVVAAGLAASVAEPGSPASAGAGSASPAPRAAKRSSSTSSSTRRVAVVARCLRLTSSTSRR